MQRQPVPIHVAVWAALLVAGAAWGQPHDVCCPEYDTASEATVGGVVEKVETRFGQAGSAAIHLIVRAGEELFDVQLGPKRFVKKQGVTFAAGDQIELVYSPVVGAERETPDASLDVVAREVARGDDKVVLREADGRPRWRAGPT